jgi:hypothetical protein
MISRKKIENYMEKEDNTKENHKKNSAHNLEDCKPMYICCCIILELIAYCE